MKRERISETIENINPKYIDEATEFKGKTTFLSVKVWHKWVIVAACFILLLGIGIPLVKDRIILSDQKEIVDIVDSVMLIDYGNAYLEIIEDPETIEKYGLEKEITKEIIGGHITYLQKEIPEAERSDYIKEIPEAERSDYIVANGETNIELLEYAPAPYKAVRIFRDGDKYYYALFCNYHVKTNESLPIKEAFEVYGINDAHDIVSITPVKSDNSWKTDGKIITDSIVISKFYNELSVLSAFCIDYHDIVFAGELKELEGEKGGDVGTVAYTSDADDRKDLIIKTKTGLRFDIEYYPSYGWIFISATMTYYQMSPEITEWLSNYAK